MKRLLKLVYSVTMFSASKHNIKTIYINFWWRDWVNPDLLLIHGFENIPLYRFHHMHHIYCNAMCALLLLLSVSVTAFTRAALIQFGLNLTSRLGVGSGPVLLFYLFWYQGQHDITFWASWEMHSQALYSHKQVFNCTFSYLRLVHRS